MCDVVVVHDSFSQTGMHCQNTMYVRLRMGMHLNQGESQWHVSAVKQNFQMHRYTLKVFVAYSSLMAFLLPLPLLFLCRGSASMQSVAYVAPGLPGKAKGRSRPLASAQRVIMHRTDFSCHSFSYRSSNLCNMHVSASFFPCNFITLRPFTPTARWPLR